jgi:hypothetical protein
MFVASLSPSYGNVHPRLLYMYNEIWN